MNQFYSRLCLLFLFLCIYLAGCRSFEEENQDNILSQNTLQKSSSYGVPSGVIVGYSSSFSETPDITISSSDPVAFKNTLESISNKNKIIFVNTDINLSSVSLPIIIQEGITLAGNRNSLFGSGAILSTNDSAPEALFKPQQNVRITGLRIAGPGGTGLIIGIHSFFGPTITIDNCELYNWTRSAIGISSSALINASLHNNYIHDNFLDGWGYGISTSDNIDAEIYQNRFDGNRHAITGPGVGREVQEIYYNDFASNVNVSHCVDMHGKYAKTNNSDDIVAGKLIHIHHNDFSYAYNGVAYIKIRGVPESYCRVENNWFNSEEKQMATRQGYIDWNSGWPNPPLGNMQIFNNEYEQGSIQGWDVSSGGNNVLQPLTRTGENLSNVTFIDVNGDARDEPFKTTGSNWLYAKFKLNDGIIYPFWDIWQTFANSSTTLNNLAFGDFNGDGKTDCFSTWGGKWHVAFTNSSGTGTAGGWQDFSDLDDNVWNLAVGDFSGDGKTDVFKATGSAWEVAFTNASGTGIVDDEWKYFANSASQLINLRFGDFNGDGKTDVFATWGGKWHVAFTNSSGTGTAGGWQDFGTSNISVQDLAFGDFNGDGKTDVFSSFSSAWNVAFTNSSGTGSSGWQVLNNYSDPLSSLKFADIDGDGKTDVVLFR